MRKKKAIQILKMQQLKLKDDSYSADKRWVIQTQDYIKYFFGENSPQYDYIRNTAFDYYKYTNESDKDIIERIQRTKIIYIRFLEDCIEIIENKGIINQNHNFLERINNQTLITVILFLISGLLYVGYLFGVSTTDSKNVELRQENKQLQDSLSVRTTFITNEEAGTNIKY